MDLSSIKRMSTESYISKCLGWKTSRIVECLIRHKTLVRDRKQFYHALDLTETRVEQWEDEYKVGSLGPYDFFSNIVESWISEKGSAATLPSLCNGLRKIQKVQVAETLEKEFNLESGNNKILHIKESEGEQMVYEVNNPDCFEQNALVRDRKQFYHALDLAETRVKQWEDEYKVGSLGPYEFFSNIMERWISEKGSAATMPSLCNGLRKIQKVQVAETFEKKFNLISGNNKILQIKESEGEQMDYEVNNPDCFEKNAVETFRYSNYDQKVHDDQTMIHSGTLGHSFRKDVNVQGSLRQYYSIQKSTSTPYQLRSQYGFFVADGNKQSKEETFNKENAARKGTKRKSVPMNYFQTKKSKDF